MRQFLTIILAGLLCCNVSAQFIFSPKKSIATLLEAIDKHEAIQLRDSIPFSYIHIIDSRYDTTRIGFFLDGYLAIKDSSQPLALQHTLNMYFHSLYTPGKDTLLLDLQKLSIQDEVIRDTNFVLTAGHIQCHEYAGGNASYKYLGVADTVMEEKYSFITTIRAHKNDKHINSEFWDYYLLRLLESMISQACRSLITPIDVSEPRSFEAIKEEGLQKRNKPILLEKSLRPGFYRNFSEFENNEPGVPLQDSALHSMLELMHYRVGKAISDEAPDTSYWGYCDGRKLFIRNGYNFFELEKKDDAFYVASTLDARRRDLNRTGWNMLIGLAELTAGIAAKERVDFRGFKAIGPPTIPMIILSLQGNNILGLQFDWDTGEITY
jgi:hypothetical protein